MGNSESEETSESRAVDAVKDGEKARRRFIRLALLGGAAAAVGVATQSRTAMGGHGDPGEVDPAAFHLGGVTNTFGRGLLSISDESPALEIINGSGSAVVADATGFGTAVGVDGHSGSPTGIGVRGAGNTGVAGVSTSPFGTPTGVRGVATGPGATLGVDGLVVGDQGTAVRGRAVSGIGPTRGVLGESLSTDGAGVEGSAPNGIGVRASGPTALLVDGKAKFATAGAGTVPADADSAAVPNSSVGANTHVSVFFNSDPGPGLSIAWIERVPGTGFVIHLSKKVNPRFAPVSFSFWFADPV